MVTICIIGVHFPPPAGPFTRWRWLYLMNGEVRNVVPTKAKGFR